VRQTDFDANTNSKVTYAFRTPSISTNNPVTEKTAHGGAIATFLDNCTSTAQLASQKYVSQGVSRHIDITYFGPLIEDEGVLIEAEILQVSARGGVIRGSLKRAKDGALLAVCTQEKIIPRKSGSRAFSL
jgi:acyl-coenzyme A thioesterase PaaI-like protein